MPRCFYTFSLNVSVISSCDYMNFPFLSVVFIRVIAITALFSSTSFVRITSDATIKLLIVKQASHRRNMPGVSGLLQVWNECFAATGVS